MKKKILFLSSLILIFIILIKFCFWIDSMSWNVMYPTFNDWKMLFYTKLFYNIDRGDIVLYKPINENLKTIEMRIWRIIAIWWDSLKLKDWEVFLKKKWDDNFIKLNEDYLSKEILGKTFSALKSKEETIYNIPEDNFFILWDNRTHSTDSRSCFLFCTKGEANYYLKKEYIVWKVW